MELVTVTRYAKEKGIDRELLTGATRFFSIPVRSQVGTGKLFLRRELDDLISALKEIAPKFQAFNK